MLPEWEPIRSFRRRSTADWVLTIADSSGADALTLTSEGHGVSHAVVGSADLGPDLLLIALVGFELLHGAAERFSVGSGA
jgi:hypothetical protein